MASSSPIVPNATTRDEIIAAAFYCFERRGMRRTRMQDVGRVANVSRQTVYSYFPSKIVLIAELLRAFLCETFEFVHSSIDFSRHGKYVLADTQRLLIARFRSPRGKIFFASDDRDLAGQAAETIDASNLAVEQVWMPLLNKLHERGELRDDLNLPEVANWLLLLNFAYDEYKAITQRQLSYFDEVLVARALFKDQ